jgi:hypothetical protein
MIKEFQYTFEELGIEKSDRGILMRKASFSVTRVPVTLISLNMWKYI